MSIKIQGTTIVDDNQGLRITGISTFTNGPVLVGTSSSTGTASQPLQVTGGAYVSGSVGIGTTNPLAKLHVSTGTLPSSLGSLPTGTRIISDVDSGSNYLTFRNTSNNTTYSGLLFQDDNIGGYVVQRSAGDSNIDFDSLLYGAVQDHVFKTNNLGISGAGTEVVRIKQSGSVGIGTTNPTTKLHVVGDGRFTGVITATTFSGTLSGFASSAGIATYATNAGIATYATNAGISTNLKGGVIGNIPYQSALDTTVFLTNGGSGTILQSNGIGATPSWVTPAPAGAITGITIRDEGTIVGGANSISTLNFVGAIVSVASTAGIATITFLDYVSNAGFATNAGIATYATSAGIATYATNAGIATNLKGGVIGNIPYQSGSNTTVFLTNGGSGTILQSNGVGNAPTWVSAAPSNAISGLTVRDEGTIVGGANSVSQFNFVGNIVSVASTAGIATITFLDYVSNAGFATNAGIASALTSTASVNTTGILTATRLSTGASGTGINIDTNTISGPSILYIDPAAIGNDTGAVRIKGDLYVDGTQFIVNSTTIELADFNVGIATTVGTNALLDGAGIGIGSTSIRKTITWNNSASALTSSDDWNLASTKQYEIAGTSVLNATTLGSGVTNSSLTSVGTLGSLNVSGTSTFQGQIQSTQANSTTTGGGQIYLNGATGNRIDFNVNGTAAPTTTTRSVGTKIVLYPLVGASSVDYAFGIEPATLWSSISDSSNQFKWYAGTTNIATLFGTGELVLGTTTKTGTASQPLQVTGGAYVSGSVGIGTTNPTTRISIAGTTGISFADTNIRIGNVSTGSSITSGNNNFFGGNNAGRYNTTGSHNNFFGCGAGFRNTTGCFNNFFGCFAGACNTTGSNNTFIGQSAGRYNTTGCNNNFFGSFAGRSNTTGIDNTFIGQSAGFCNTTGSHNNFFGCNAGACNTTGSHNNFFGCGAGCYNTTGCNNTFIGQNAGFCNTFGSHNTFFGQDAGAFNTTGSHNNFIGLNAGISNTTGSFNNFIGSSAGRCNTFGCYNNFFGCSAGRLNTTGSNNNFIGQSAGACNTTGSFNNFFGLSAGSCNTTGSNNNFIGQSAGFRNTTGCFNNFFGCFAGACNTTGSNNNFFGCGAGQCNTTGSQNVIIGSNQQAPILNGSNQLVIGAGNTAWITGNSSYNVGIGTTNPVNTLQVFGGIVAGNATSATSQSGFSILRPNDSTPRTFAIAETDTDLRIGGGAWNNVNIRTAPSNDVRVAITSSGNIGIGTTNPTSTLQVSGTFYNSGIGTFANGNTTYGTTSASSLELGLNNNSNAGTLKLWGATSNAYGLIQATTNNLHIDCVVGGTYLNYYDGDFVSFGTGASGESARFTGSTGTLTLGTITPTGTSSQLLQVTGGAYFAGVGFATGSIGVGITNPQGTIDIRTSPQWSSFNYGANLIIGGARNNAIGILDSGNTNPWAIVNGAGNLLFAQMPPLGNTTSGVSEAARITSNRNLLIGTLTETGTTSQTLQVTGGAYVSGNLGIGITNPGVKLDVYSPSSSTAIRATIGASYSATLYHGAISGLSTNAASAYSSQFAASGVGATSGEVGVYSFYPTFANFPADRGPRRAVDLVGGFATSAWGTEYFAINVGRDGTANDSAILTNERLRIDGSGNVGIGTTNPSDKLHVLGGSIRVDSSTGLLQFWNGAGFYGSIGAASGFGPTNSDIVIRADAARSIVFQTGGANDRGRFDSSGTFLVGTSSSTGTASQLLQVTGGAYVSGSVGIGTTNPGTGPKLDVVSTTSESIWARNGAIPSGYLFFGVSSSDYGRIGYYNSSGGWKNIAINEGGGNVLIGSVTPTGTTSQTLQVTGGAYISGNLGVGVTAPTFTADIAGDARVTSTNKMRFGGTAGTTNFYIQYNSTANSLDFVAG